MDRLSVPEPSLLHVTSAQMQDGGRVFAFEARWLELIDALSDASAIGYDYLPAISQKMESLLWGKATSPAWVEDRHLKNRLLPLFFQRLRPMFVELDEADAESLNVDPALDDREGADPWLTSAMRLLAAAIELSEDVVVESGINGPQASTCAVKLADGSAREIAIVHGYEDFLKSLPMREICRQSSGEVLPRLVKLSIRRFCLLNPSRIQQYRYEFDDRFLDHFDDAPPEMRVGCVDALVSRLTQTQKSAQADKGLKDEPFKDAERRMRVTRDWRIHYLYPAESTIRLISLGDHDFGLKK